jgi:hypothetical protein
MLRDIGRMEDDESLLTVEIQEVKGLLIYSTIIY